MEFEKFTVRIPADMGAKLRRYVGHAQIEDATATLETAVTAAINLYCVAVEQAYGKPDPRQIVALVRGRRPGNPGTPSGKPRKPKAPKPGVPGEASPGEAPL